MRMVTTPSAALPDAIVWRTPACSGGPSQFDQIRLGCAIERASSRHPHECRLDQLAVSIELKLPGGEVTDANRTRASVAGKPRKLAFSESRLPVHPIHHSHIRPGEMRRVEQPREERLGLDLEFEIAQGTKRQ